MSSLSHKVILRRPQLLAVLRRTFSTTTNVNEAADVGGFGFTAEDLRSAKPFKSIPGPQPYPLIGNLLSFKPFGDINFFDKIASGKIMNDRYGPISRYYLPFLPTPDVVELLDPNDFEVVYRNEGKLPFRPPLFALEKYKRDRKHSPGVSAVSGEEWWKLRKPLNQIVMKPNAITPYFKTHDLIANELINSIRVESKLNGARRHPEIMSDVIRWSVESVGAVIFDKRLGLMDANFKENSRMKEFIDSVNGAFQLVLSLSLNPKYLVYDYFGLKAKQQKNFEKYMDFMTDTALMLIKEAQHEWVEMPQEELKNKFLPHLMSLDGLSFDEKMSMVFDMMAAAVDTTSYSVVHCLFCLAKNPEVQERLFSEIDEHIGGDASDLQPAQLSKLLYLRACVKEMFRFKPLFPSNHRILEKDIVVRNYRIPKGTTIFLEQSYASINPEHVDDAHIFKPERWLRNETGDGEKVNPFLTVPFGFGARMCIGRRFAEQELYIALTKLVKNFRFEYDGEKLPLKGIFVDALPVKLDFIVHER